MDARNHNQVQPVLQQPFKFQAQRHQHPLLSQKPPPYQVSYTSYQQDQQQYSGYPQTSSQQNNNQVNPNTQTYQTSNECGVSTSNSDQLQATGKPVVRPIRHDFWARR